MASEEEIVSVIGRLVAAYPSANVTDATVAVYVEELMDIDAELLAGAAKKCRATSKWFPTIAELRESAVSIAAPLVRSGADAWGDVLRAITAHGYLHAPGDGWDFEDRLVGRIVKGMGWRDLCLSEEGMVDRAHFIKAYEQDRERAYVDAQLPLDI